MVNLEVCCNKKDELVKIKWDDKEGQYELHLDKDVALELAARIIYAVDVLKDEEP